MTPSEVTKQDLEALVGKANEFAKDMGVTLDLDPSRIRLQPSPKTSYNGHFVRASKQIVLEYNQKTDFSSDDLAWTLVHEGIHEKFDKEILPKYQRNIFGYYLDILTEVLAYSAQFFSKPKHYLELWKQPDEADKANTFLKLSYATAQACKNGMKMDEIFNKLKAVPYSPSDPDIVIFARYTTDVLGLNLADVFGKEEVDMIEKALAMCAVAEEDSATENPAYDIPMLGQKRGVAQ
jgi:hypothetical protein